MQAQQDEQRIREQAEKIAFVERARALLKGFNLMDADELRQARELLQREGIPQWTIFAVPDIPPTTDEGMRWAERRLQEMRDLGELP
jgi:hypothetical protein